MFESFYASYWQNPLLMWLGPLATLLWLARSRPRGWLGVYLWIFAVQSAADPLCTVVLVKSLELSGSWVDTTLMVVMVLLGDFRFWLPLQRARSKSTASALSWTLIIPLLTVVLMAVWQPLRANLRYTFFAYELMMFVLVTSYQLVLVRHRQPAFCLGLCRFVRLHYLLWLTADVIILMGLDWGYAVRVVPNLMYYGLTVPFIWWTAPANLKAS